MTIDLTESEFNAHDAHIIDLIKDLQSIRDMSAAKAA